MAGSILSRPEVEKESRSSCCLSRGEAAPLGASRPPRAASPRGLHGPGSATRDARVEGQEAAAAREQGRCLSPTSELFSPAAAAAAAAALLPETRSEAPRISGGSGVPGRALV